MKENIVNEEYFVLSLPHGTTVLQKLGGTRKVILRYNYTIGILLKH